MHWEWFDVLSSPLQRDAATSTHRTSALPRGGVLALSVIEGSSRELFIHLDGPP